MHQIDLCCCAWVVQRRSWCTSAEIPTFTTTFAPQMKIDEVFDNISRSFEAFGTSEAAIIAITGIEVPQDTETRPHLTLGRNSERCVKPIMIREHRYSTNHLT
jgi:hypothetical protein